MTTFRLFYDYLVELGELEQSPISDLHERRRRTSQPTTKPRQRLSPSEQVQLVDAAAHISPAAVAVIRLLLDGLTVTQLGRAQVSDLATNGTGATLTTRHRGLPQVIMLRAETVDVLTTYPHDRMAGPLLTDDVGRPIDRFDIACKAHRRC